MTVKLFGTDGIRGTSNTEPMTAETALRVGMAAAVQFVRGDHRHQVVIGKDTRLSGYLLEPALTAGFISMGMNVVLVGPIPTPAVAMLTRSLRADLGVMISASHNPYEDNGIKLFGPDGFKLSDADEVEIEARVNSDMTGERAGAANLGHARRLDDVRGRYNEYVKQTFPRGLRLDGLKVAVDCATGAAYKAAPEVLWELGAEVVPIGVDPDGFNINKGCGSIDTDYMRSLSMAHSADMGLALDGDADRVLISDEKGALIVADQILGRDRKPVDEQFVRADTFAAHLFDFAHGVDRGFETLLFLRDRLRLLGIVPQGRVFDARVQLVEFAQRALPVERPAHQRQRGFDPIDVGLPFGTHGILSRNGRAALGRRGQQGKPRSAYRPGGW